MIIRPSYLIALFALHSCNNPDTKAITQDKTDSISIPKKDSTVAPKKDSTPALPVNTAPGGPGSIPIDENYILRATVSKEDSSLWITPSMRHDHRIFGYEKPDTASRKMILLSIFTNDVKDNPFHCPYGAYYGTGDMTDMKLKYASTAGRFIRVDIIKDNKPADKVYMERKWIEFEK